MIKLHRYSGRVTYLVRPGLDRKPDPALELWVKVRLPALAIEVFDYSGRGERPGLGMEPRLLRRARNEASSARDAA